VSNPPYSVSAFKNAAHDYYTEKDFELYDSLTDNSSEIECLFVERMKQLLKDGGVAGIILPKSILEKDGINTKTREIILQYFEIIAITELGNSAFMATGTKTVVLFLRRKNNYESINLKKSVEIFFENYQDTTHNGIEKPVERYINYVWKNIGFDDYVSLLKKAPNQNIENHEFYKTYRQELRTKNEKDFWDELIALEKEKLFYFILAFKQKIVLVKVGEKDEEKHFLGYKFSDRKENVGILPMQIDKEIHECTQLFDEDVFDNPQKASTYIYNAFNKKFSEIDETLEKNIFYPNLIDMFTFNQAKFEKDLSLKFKEKIEFKTKWDKQKLGNIFVKIESGKRPRGGVAQYRAGIPSLGGEHIGVDGKMNYLKMKFVPKDYFNSATQGILEDLDILLCKDGALTGKIALFKKSEFPYSDGMINEHVFALKAENEITQKYVFYVLFSFDGQKLLKANVTGQAQGGLNRNNLENITIPFPPKGIQEKIVSEIENLEEKAKSVVIADLDEQINQILKKYLQ
jgi:type I restriction enzyme M protein